MAVWMVFRFGKRPSGGWMGMILLFMASATALVIGLLLSVVFS
jgi:hypothetical protein